MVICNICQKSFRTLTNTHLALHGLSVKTYLEKYPEESICTEEYRQLQSKQMKGVNKGRKRKDAAHRMNRNNPMKNSQTAQRVGTIRKTQIQSGEYPAMKNFNHLPSEKESTLINWFQEWGIPLTYVGDGQKNINGYFPDFINEDLKIIVELELNFCSRPRNTMPEKEKVYLEHGYKTVWITQWDKNHIKNWICPLFQGGIRFSKIKRIWEEEHHHPVYNFEVSPNNTYIANHIVVHNCYANAFRASLYTAFFDNSKTMGFRHCNPDFYQREIDKMLKYRILSMEEKRKLSGINKAFGLEIPIRMGIRFEDFLRNEKRDKISLAMLNYLADIEYPVMINTKSNIPGEDAYVRALSRNPAHTAIHITTICKSNEVLKRIEPGAPSYEKRIEAMRNLSSAGVRVVSRIEPYLFLLTDDPDEVGEYMEDVWDAGVRNITFDTYSYTAQNPGIRQSFINVGYDFDRMFMAGCDSQPFGSLLLGKFMDLFRERGFSCSTFDMGNTPTNDQNICCEVGDWFQGGWNYGCTVMAARYIKQRAGRATAWKHFEKYVVKNGGFLTPELKNMVKELWNLNGNVAYSHRWAAGMIPCGLDEDGLIWRWDGNSKDYRMEILEGML